jgi:hypothetical protein
MCPYIFATAAFRKKKTEPSNASQFQESQNYRTPEIEIGISEFREFLNSEFPRIFVNIAGFDLISSDKAN